MVDGESLIQDLQRVLGLLELHTSGNFWFHDFARLVPGDTRQQLLDFGIDRFADDYAGEPNLSTVIDLILFHNVYDGGFEDEFHQLVAALDAPLHSIDECAHLVSRRLFYAASLSKVLEEAQQLFDECQRYDFDSTSRGIQNLVHSFEMAAHSTPLWMTECRGKEYEKLYDETKVERRHPLVPTDYLIFVPPGHSRAFSDSFDQILAECARTPQLIRRLSPRDFEKFLVRIFEGFGFDVQLTAQTRDGGADLICMSGKHGLPIKLAVEAKRYAPDNPVTVELVRSFVGANEEIKANKLIYVTTSRYTRDATKFAKLPTITHMLELKEFPDIIQWASEANAERHAIHLTNR